MPVARSRRRVQGTGANVPAAIPGIAGVPLWVWLAAGAVAMGLVIAGSMWLGSKSDPPPQPQIQAEPAPAIDVNQYRALPEWLAGTWKVTMVDEPLGKRRVESWEKIGFGFDYGQMALMESGTTTSYSAHFIHTPEVPTEVAIVLSDASAGLVGTVTAEFDGKRLELTVGSGDSSRTVYWASKVR